MAEATVSLHTVTADCLVYMADNQGSHKDDICYEITCNSCNDIYIGETADIAYIRVCQHSEALQMQTKDSVLHLASCLQHENQQLLLDVLLMEMSEGNTINDCNDCKHQSIWRIVLWDGARRPINIYPASP